MSSNGFRCYESQQIKTCWAKPYEIFWQQEASKQCPKNFQVLSTQWPGLHKRTRFDPSCINRLRFSWARNKKIRKRRHFEIMMVRLMLLLLLIAPLTLTSYADSGQKVIKLKIYIAFTFRRDTLKWPFGPFCLKERHGVYVPAKYFILRPVRVVLSTLNERVFVSRANLIIMPLKGDLKSKVPIYTIAKVMTLKYW